MKLKNTLGVVVSAVLAASSLSVMAQGQGAVEVDVFGQYYAPDSSRNVTEGDLYGTSIGYYLTEDVSLGLSYGEYHSMNSDDSYPGIGHKEIKGSLAALNATYHFGSLGDSLRPFVSSSVAHQSLSNTPARTGRDQTTFVNVGTGAKYFITENLFAKVNVDAMYGLDTGETEWMAGVGVGLNFGGAGKPVEAAPVIDVCTDSDNDGVCDDVDKCPDTAANVTVDADGCPAVAEVVRVELDVKFDFDKSVVKEESYSEIKTVADFMNQYPQTTTTVEGYTDSVGTDAYNQQLSQRRADAVRQVMVDQYGVAADRVNAVGEGESQPVADNATAEGRALNRRVEASVEAQAK